MLKKTIEGLAQLILFLALLLFLPAWTLHYWQGWTYFTVFSISTLLITIDLWQHDRKLLERRLKAGPRSESRKSQNLIQALASLCFMALMVIPAVDHRFRWSHVPALASAAGDLLVTIAFFAIYRVFRVNTFTAGTIEIAEEQTVISTGPYAVVRHPMYSAALLLFLGTPLALGSLWGLLLLLPLSALLAARLLDEETLLKEKLRGYREYAEKVRFRLVPFMW